MTSKFHNKKIIIIGSGFRAMMTAFYCLKKSNDVTLLSKNENIHGVMSPIKWLGGNFDKGYHFFDGFNIRNKKILEEFVDKENLYDFGYGAATYTNNKTYPDHGIPYWLHKSLLFSFNSFIQYLFLIFKKKNINIESYQDLLCTLPSNISKILEKACLRNTNLNANELSSIVSRYSHFLCYRQTIFPDTISNFLKKINFFNERLASRRKSLNLDQISLYPKGKNMGFIACEMEKKLKELGLKIIISEKNQISNSNNRLVVSSDKGSHNPDYIFIVTELDDALKLFEEKISDKKNNHFVSQVLYYFATNTLHSKFQYIHGNDINIYTNRATNISLYGEKTNSNEFVISAEVPTKINSDVWRNSESFKEIIWNELKMMNMVAKNQNFTNYKIFNVEKTLSVPLINFDNSLKTFHSLINSKYSNKILLPGVGTFTRNIFMNSLNSIFKNENK